MGQGQAEIALKLLDECARQGEWLCLKNLHLVTAWLPTLEKVSCLVKIDKHVRMCLKYRLGIRAILLSNGFLKVILIFVIG